MGYFLKAMEQGKEGNVFDTDTKALMEGTASLGHSNTTGESAVSLYMSFSVVRISCGCWVQCAQLWTSGLSLVRISCGRWVRCAQWWPSGQRRLRIFH